MQRRDFIHLLLIPATAALLPGCASESERQRAGLRFTPGERQTISDYFAQRRGRGPADPPAQTVRAGDKLAPGPRRRRLPNELESQLPALASPYIRLIVGADVALINQDTHHILDVIPQVAY